MYFPIPSPFDNEYPVILNWWDPLTVSVTEVDVVVCGGQDDEEDGFDDDGFEVSR